MGKRKYSVRQNCPGRLRSVRVAAGTALMAATVAAVTRFAPASASATTRMQAVHQDLMRAVQLGQVSREQAERFEARMSKQINWS